MTGLLGLTGLTGISGTTGVTGATGVDSLVQTAQTHGSSTPVQILILIGVLSILPGALRSF